MSSEKIVLAVEGEVDVPERLRLIKLANSVTFDRYVCDYRNSALHDIRLRIGTDHDMDLSGDESGN